LCVFNLGCPRILSLLVQMTFCGGGRFGQILLNSIFIQSWPRWKKFNFLLP
jgi:hypothetical protein